MLILWCSTSVWVIQEFVQRESISAVTAINLRVYTTSWSISWFSSRTLAIVGPCLHSFCCVFWYVALSLWLQLEGGYLFLVVLWVSLISLWGSPLTFLKESSIFSSVGIPFSKSVNLEGFDHRSFVGLWILSSRLLQLFFFVSHFAFSSESWLSAPIGIKRWSRGRWWWLEPGS